MVRRVIAIALLILGAWLFWGAVQAVLAFTSRGGPLMSALMEPPTSLIRLIGTGLMALGGVLAALNLRAGGLAGLVGAIIFAGLGGLIALAGAERSIWIDELVLGGIGIALAGGLLSLRRA